MNACTTTRECIAKRKLICAAELDANPTVSYLLIKIYQKFKDLIQENKLLILKEAVLMECANVIREARAAYLSINAATLLAPTAVHVLMSYTTR